MAMSMKHERLEFLGDRVLGLVMAEWLFLRFPNDGEGEIGTRHSRLVSKQVMADVAQQKWPDSDFRNEKAATDMLEVTIAGIYLEKGLKSAETFIRNAWHSTLAQEPAEARTDPKSKLQTLGKGDPVYHVLSKTGPDHQPHFSIVCYLGDRWGWAAGRSKKLAETAAAQDLLATLGVAA